MFTSIVLDSALTLFTPETPKAVVLNLGSIQPQGFAESLSGVRQGSRHTHYSTVHTPLSVTQNKFSPLVLVVTPRSAWPSLAAADHATLLGFDVWAAGNLVVDLWLLWLYVICDFLLIFQSLHTNCVEQKKKVVGRIRTIWIHVYKGTKEICFEEIIFYFSNYEGFGEFTDEACRVQYLQ